MVIERTDTEVIIRLAANVDIDVDELQEMVDYARYKEIVAKVNVSQDEIDKFAKEVKKGLWTKNRHKYI